MVLEVIDEEEAFEEVGPIGREQLCWGLNFILFGCLEVHCKERPSFNG
jgi:hypothetical protein